MSKSKFKETCREAIGPLSAGLAAAAVAGAVPALAATGGDDIQVSLTIDETEALGYGEVLRLHIGASNDSNVFYAALWADVKFGDKDGYLVGTEEIELLGWLPAYGRRSYVVDVPVPKGAGATVVLKDPKKPKSRRCAWRSIPKAFISPCPNIQPITQVTLCALLWRTQARATSTRALLSQ